MVGVFDTVWNPQMQAHPNGKSRRADAMMSLDVRFWLKADKPSRASNSGQTRIRLKWSLCANSDQYSLLKFP
jgi:hypothetical protein